MQLASYAKVIHEAFPSDEELQGIARQEMTYIGNHTGGRPSDHARTAVYYVQAALDTQNVNRLASPTAQIRMQGYLNSRFGGIQS
jgi:hypothetical protein